MTSEEISFSLVYRERDDVHYEFSYERIPTQRLDLLYKEVQPSLYRLFGIGRLRFYRENHEVIDESLSLSEAGIKNGDRIILEKI